MRIDAEEVRRIAALASIEIEPERVDEFRSQLERILDHVTMLEELEADDVAPTSHVLGPRRRSRPDRPSAPLPRDDALANAPDALEGFFRVPSVLPE